MDYLISDVFIWEGSVSLLSVSFSRAYKKSKLLLSNIDISFMSRILPISFDIELEVRRQVILFSRLQAWQHHALKDHSMNPSSFLTSVTENFITNTNLSITRKFHIRSVSIVTLWQHEFLQILDTASHKTNWEVQLSAQILQKILGTKMTQILQPIQLPIKCNCPATYRKKSTMPTL
jgi:hypothetical protein